MIKEGYTIEILNEAEAYIDNKISIHVDPTVKSNFKYDPYIKVYDGPYSTAKNNVRIYLKDVGLDYSHKDRGKQFGDLKMSNSLARTLNDIMDMKFEKEYINKYGNRKKRVISVYGYIWAIIHTVLPDAKYINKPDFTKYYIRKE